MVVGEECFDPSREVVEVVQDFGFLGKERGAAFDIFQFALTQNRIGCVEQGAATVEDAEDVVCVLIRC